MAKPKDSPTLIEVMDRTEPIGDSTPKTPTTSASQPHTAAVTSTRQGAAQTADAGPVSREPVVVIDGDRLRFSVSTLNLAAILFVLLLIVVASFQLGRRSAVGSDNTDLDRLQGAVDDEISRVRQQAPEPDVLEDLQKVQRSIQATAARQNQKQREVTDGRVIGLNYVWIETFDDSEQARNAKTYLSREGVDASAYQLNGSQKRVLISTRGFDYQIPQDRRACDQLQKRIRAIGQEFMKEHGNYSFQHCYVRKKKENDSW